ncbi:MAG TPA: DUF2142 domain-containing protein [Thermoleophilaceae bacterium]
MTPRRLVLAGWILLSLAWAFGNPPFAGPDERAHYLRALEVGRGHLITERRPDLAEGATEAQLAWNRELSYAASVPPHLAPHDHQCWTSDPALDAGCLDDFRPPDREVVLATQVGPYQPFPYLLPGAATRAADTAGPADRLARLANALLCLALLWVALRMTWRPEAGALSLVGLLLAVTPMAVFCASMLGGSGPEIAAAIAFTAAALRLRRDPSAAGAWAGLGAGGAVLALSRTSGPAYLAAIALSVLALGGTGPALRLLRERGRVAVAAVVSIVAAVALSLAWDRAHGAAPDTGFANLRAVAGDAVGEWWRASSELVGKFGYLEYRLPAVAYATWLAAGFGLVAVALWAAGRRERIALGAVLAAAAAFPMLLWVYAIRQTGFGLQGRYVLPVLVVVPLIAGELVAAHAASLGERLRRAFARWMPALAGAVHLLAFYWAARRAAVGTDGPYLFLGDSGWSPPLGWVVWLLIAALGAGLVAAAPRAATRPGARPAARSARPAARP